MADNCETMESLVAIFWDIENCNVPRGKSAVAVVRCIRDRFCCGDAKEAEFLCVCDVSKEPPHLIAELNDSQVTVVHVSNEHKNAADDKLRQCMRKFCDSHKAPVVLVLISGDVDFAADLSHMRHSHKYRIILVHNKRKASLVKTALAITAHQIHEFEEIVANAPEKEQNALDGNAVEGEVHWVNVTDLPTHVDLSRIKARLASIANKTKGTLIHCDRKMAICKYSHSSWAARAAKRMNRQDVFGSKILANHLTNATLGQQPVVSSYSAIAQSAANQQNSKVKYSTANGTDNSDLTKVGVGGLPTPPSSALAPGTFVKPHSCGEQVQSLVSGSCGAVSPFYFTSQHTSAFSRTPGKPRSDPSMFSSVESTPRSVITPRATCPAPHKPPNHYSVTSQRQPQRTLWEASRNLYNNVAVPPVVSNYNSRLLYTTPLSHLPSIDSAMRVTSMFQPICEPRQLFSCSSGTDTPTSAKTQLRALMGTNPQLYPAVRPRAIIGQSPSPTVGEARVVTPLREEGITLAVTNLDYNISAKEWLGILHQLFQSHTRVQNIKIETQQDGTNMALVDVPSVEDGRIAISHCHRHKVGYKRIQVSIHTPESPNNQQRIRSEVASILCEVSGHTLPLFKFIELYERRFYRTISVSDLYHMKDTVEVKEHAGTGRMLCLQTTLALPGYLTTSGKTPSPKLTEFSEAPYCTLHCSPSDFTLIEESGMLPYVKIDMRRFTKHVHNLLNLHGGSLYLMSFPFCYGAAYTKLVPAVEGGVPLEHLISCVFGVQIKLDNLGVKKISWVESRSASPTGSETSSGAESISGRMGHVLNQQLSQFAREVVDLLKRMPGCQMSFSKFIPSYHHHFGRQCRVADFGFTKLLELFEAIPHVLQILGTGNQRILYLTHRIHLRRFTADLCRVLKARTEKECTIASYPDLYSEVMGTELNMPNFGVCYIRDMLLEVSETQVVVTGAGNQAVMSIPRKDQTSEEMERTKQFAYEVIDLLKNCPQCTMIFNKFIPSYHHHFGRQCRVADYGFTKLIELFEAIPDIVNISESGEERFISLTKTELYKVLSEQILSLLKHHPTNALNLKEIGPAYQKAYGHTIYIEEFGVTSLEDLIEKIPHIARVENRAGANTIVLRNKLSAECLARRCLELLMAKSNGVIRLSRFMERYREYFDDSADLVEVKHSLFPAILITEDETCGTISLHPLLSVARRIMILLTNNQGKLTLLNFEMAYRQSFGISLNSQQCGYPGVGVMLQIMDFMVSIRGRSNRQTILLRQDYISRLAHQLVYKVGIYTELLKYKDLSKENTRHGSGTANLRIPDESFLVKSESIVRGSPDMFVSADGSQLISRPPLQDDFPVNSLTPELNQARRALNALRLAQPGEKIPPAAPLRLLPSSNVLNTAARALENILPHSAASVDDTDDT